VPKSVPFMMRAGHRRRARLSMFSRQAGVDRAAVFGCPSMDAAITQPRKHRGYLSHERTCSSRALRLSQSGISTSSNS
jgi:hypothetical protein